MLRPIVIALLSTTGTCLPGSQASDGGGAGDVGAAPPVLVQPPQRPSETVLHVRAGGYWTCAHLKTGRASCWGAIGQSQVPEFPATHPNLTGQMRELGKGHYQHTCGLRTDGTATCSGQYDAAALGPPADHLYSDFSVGAFHHCGVLLDGTLECFGDERGASPLPSGAFVEVSAGMTHTCARRADGTVACWGVSAFDPVGSPTGTFTRLESGFQTCGQRADGTLECWGDSPGLGASAPPPGPFVDFDVGVNHACGVRADGSAACWGAMPTMDAPPGVYVEISVGMMHACGLLRSGEIQCWGEDQYSQSRLPPTL